MSDKPNDNEPDIDQVIRINELREAVREVTGDELTSWESPDTSPEVSEAFWRNVLAYESAEGTTHFKQLEELGIDLPAPDSLDDPALTAKLSEVIEGLARVNTFLSQTDHLDDRRLYELLWDDVLHEDMMESAPDSGWQCHLDLLSSGSDEDNYIYLKYYADEDERAYWRQDYPDEIIPEHMDPPYDRDRKLPQAPPP